jgi:hypothetical protein
MGPCMCGDPYCGSCGPAQGNYRCPNCGIWSMDGGCKNPEECCIANAKIDDELEKAWAEQEAFEKAHPWPESSE